MTAVGLAWPLLMWLTPAADRPWIAGTNDNSITAWLADAVESGRIRYVLTSGGSGLPNDGRTGADAVMAAVQAVGKPVSSVSGLYDLKGLAAQLRSQ